MAILRRILCLLAVLAGLLCPVRSEEAGTVPSAFWQDGKLRVFAQLPEAPGEDTEPRLQLGPADLTLPADGPLVRVADAGIPISYLLLVDRSNSMGGLDWNVESFAKRLVRSEATFALATFGTDFQLTDIGDGSGDELLSALDDITYDEEGTDLPTAVVAAMDHLAARSRQAGELVNLIILTDGVTEAVADGEAMEMAHYRVEEDPSVLVHTVGLATGREVSQEALDGLAALGRGAHIVVGPGGVSADAAARTVAGTAEDLWTVSFPVTAEEDHFFADAALCLFQGDDQTPTQRFPLPDPPLLSGEGGGPSPAEGCPSPSQTPNFDGEGTDPVLTPEPSSTAEPPSDPAAGETVEVPPKVGSDGFGKMVCLKPMWIAGGIGLAVASLAAVLLLRRRRAGGKQSPVPPGAIRLQLEVLEGRCDQDGQEFYLTGELTIGRGRHCDLVFRERALPPRAGRICLWDGFLFLEELDPRCDTLLEGMRLYGPSRLRSGDVISMGPARFLFRF